MPLTRSESNRIIKHQPDRNGASSMDLDFHMAKKRTDEYGVTVYKHKGVIIGYTWTDEEGKFHLYRYPVAEVEAERVAQKQALRSLKPSPASV